MVLSKQTKMSKLVRNGFRTVVLSGVTLAICAGLAVAGELPKAETVLAKYVESVGGEAAFAKLKNRVFKGKMIMPSFGMEATMVTYIKPPSSSYSELDFEAFGKSTSGTNGDVAWEVSAMQGPRLLEGADKARRFREAQLNPYLNWQESFDKAETTGEGTVGDAECYKVVMTPKAGEPITCFFDKKSGLLLEMETETEAGTMTITPTDYRDVDGIKIAFKTTVEADMFSIETIVESVEHNVDIAEDRFELPDEIKQLLE